MRRAFTKHVLRGQAFPTVLASAFQKAARLVGVGAVSLIVSMAQAQQAPRGTEAEIAAPEVELPLAIAPEDTSALPIRLALSPRDFHRDIVTLTGDLRLTYALTSVGARGWPLTLGLTYSREAPDVGFGPGWSSTFATAGTRDRATGSWAIVEADGSQSVYASLGPGAFEAISGRTDARLFAYSDGTLERVFADGSREVFDSFGVLMRRDGPAGSGYWFDYASDGRLLSVTHDDGQQISFAWQDGRITAASHPLAGTWYFTYAGDSRQLSRMLEPMGRETGFVYGADGLAGVTMADGQTLMVDYDAAGHVATLTGPGRFETQFTHWGDVDSGRIVQTTTDAACYATRLELRSLGGPDAGSDGSIELISTDAAGIVTHRTYRDGQVDVSAAGGWIGGLLTDDAGQPEALLFDGGMTPVAAPSDGPLRGDLPDERGFAQLVADEFETRWQTYDALGRVVALAGADGIVERYDFDAGGRVVRASREGWWANYTYDAGDRLIAEETSDGQWGRYTYTDEGLVARIETDNGPPQSMRYGPAGRITGLDDGDVFWSVRHSASGQPIEMASEDGRTLRFAYDEAGLLIGFENHMGLSIALPSEPFAPVQDSLGRSRVVTLVDGHEAIVSSDGTTTVMIPAENGDTIVETTSPDGSVWVERLAPDGRFLGAEAWGDRPAIVDVDDDGRLVASGDPEAPILFDYDDQGLLTRRTAPNGAVTTYTHDADGRLTSVASPYDSISIGHNEDGLPNTLTMRDGTVLRQDLDLEGRPLRLIEESATGSRTEETFEYDAEGRLIRHGFDDRMVLEFSYDGPNRQTTTVTAGGIRQVITEEWDPAARTLTRTGADGQVTTILYDEGGRMIESRSGLSVIRWELDADGVPTAVEIDGHRRQLGQMSAVDIEVLSSDVFDPPVDGVARVETVRDGRGYPWVLRYDTRGRLVEAEDPLGGVTTFVLDDDDQLIARIDPEGRTHTATYDDLGRQVDVGVAGGWSVAQAYDGNVWGALSYSGGATVSVRAEDRTIVGMVNGVDAQTRRFDAFGRMIAVDSAVGTTSLTYGDGNLLVGETGPFGQVLAYGHDTTGVLDRITLPGAGEIRISHRADGVDQIGPDGVETAVTFFPDQSRYALRLDGLDGEITLGAGNVLNAISVGETQFSVERDGQGLVEAILHGAARTEIERDALGRVVQAGGLSWAFDGSGNVTEAPGVTRSFDSAFRQSDGPRRAVFDADGRQIAAGDTQFSYDPVGRLVGVSRGDGPDVTLRYDALGRVVEQRIGAQVERYLWGADGLAAVHNGSGERLAWIEHNQVLPALKRVHLPDRSITLLTDHVGTPVIAVEDGSARLLDAYGLWGAPPEGQDAWARWIGFGGAVAVPEHGLSLFHHRAYSSADQRFLTPDPLGLLGSANPFAFADNDPATFADHSGLNSVAVGIGPSNLPPQDLTWLRPPGVPGRGEGWGTAHHARVEQFLSDIANGPPGPRQRVAQETLDVLNSTGLELNINEAAASTPEGRLQYGHASGTPTRPGLTVNTGNIAANTTRQLGRPHGPTALRAASSVYVHEATHILQRASQASGGQMGRTWREVEAVLRQGLFDPQHGGFGMAGRNSQDSLRRALDYGLSTQYRAYTPGDGLAPHLPNQLGITQLNERQIVELARRYHPNLPASTVLREFREAHSRALRTAIHNGAVLGPDTVNRLGELARRTRSLERTALVSENIRAQNSRPGIGPRRPGLDQARANRPTLDANRANRPTLDASRSARPNIDAPRSNVPDVGPARGTDVSPYRDLSRTDRVPINQASGNRPRLDATTGARPSLDSARANRPTLGPARTGAYDLVPTGSNRPSASPELQRERVSLDQARATRPGVNTTPAARPPSNRPATGSRPYADHFDGRGSRPQLVPEGPPRSAQPPRPGVRADAPRPAANRPAAGTARSAVDPPNRPTPRSVPDRPARPAPNAARPAADTPRAAPDAPRSAPDAPRSALDAPRTTPDAPRTTPDAPCATPDAPRTTPDAPRSTPDAPRTTPDAPSTTPDAPRTTPDAPRGTPDAPRGTPDTATRPTPTRPNAPDAPRTRTPGAAPGPAPDLASQSRTRPPPDLQGGRSVPRGPRGGSFGNYIAK